MNTNLVSMNGVHPEEYPDQKSESKEESSNTKYLSKRNNCMPNNNYSEDCVVGAKRNKNMPTNNYTEDCVIGPRQNATHFNLSEYPEIDEAPKPIRKFTFLKKGQNKEPSGKMNSDTTNNYSKDCVIGPRQNATDFNLSEYPEIDEAPKPIRKSTFLKKGQSKEPSGKMNSDTTSNYSEDSVVGPKGNKNMPTNNYSKDCVIGPRQNATDFNLSEYPEIDEAPKPIRKFTFLKKGQNKEPSGKMNSDTTNNYSKDSVVGPKGNKNMSTNNYSKDCVIGPRQNATDFNLSEYPEIDEALKPIRKSTFLKKGQNEEPSGKMNSDTTNNYSKDCVIGPRQNATDFNLSEYPEIDEAPKPIRKSIFLKKGQSKEPSGKMNSDTTSNYSEDSVVGPKGNKNMPTNNYSKDCVIGPRQNATDFNLSEYPEIDEAPKPIRKFTFLKKGQNKEPSGKMNSDTTNNYSKDCVIGPRQNATDFNLSEYQEIDEAPKPIRKSTFLKKGQNKEPSGKMNSDTTNNYSKDSVVGPKGNKNMSTNNYSKDCVIGPRQNATDFNLSEYPEIDEALKPIRKSTFLKKGQNKEPSGKMNSDTINNYSKDCVIGPRQNATDFNLSEYPEIDEAPKPIRKSTFLKKGQSKEPSGKMNSDTTNNYSEDSVVGPKGNKNMPTNNYSKDCAIGPRQNATDFNLSEYPEIDEAPKPIRKFTFLKKGQNKEPSGKMNSDTTNNYSKDCVVGPKRNNYNPNNNYSEDCIVGPKRKTTDSNLNLSEYPEIDEAPMPIRKFKFLKKGQNNEPSGKLNSDSSNKEATTSNNAKENAINGETKAKDGQKVKKQSGESKKANAKNEQEQISTSEIFVTNNACLSKTVDVQVSIEIEPPMKPKADKMCSTDVPCNQVKHDTQNLILVYLAIMCVLIGFILLLIEIFRS